MKSLVLVSSYAPHQTNFYQSNNRFLKGNANTTVEEVKGDLGCDTLACDTSIIPDAPTDSVSSIRIPIRGIMRSPSSLSKKGSTVSFSTTLLEVSPAASPTTSQSHSAVMTVSKTKMPEDLAPKMDMQLEPDAKPTRRLTKRLSKRFSAPAQPVRKETDSKRLSVISTFSLPALHRKSSVVVSSAATPASQTHSLQSTGSLSTAPGSSTTRLSRIPETYDSFQNYIPCLAPNCPTHYLLPLLGPTFYSPQVPYNLSRIRGLCPLHARADLQQATLQCKRQYENMRQHAGRKTLSLIAAEFEIWMQHVREEREVQNLFNERRQKLRIQGAQGGRDLGEYDWRYALRPCTSKTCPNPNLSMHYYSVFDHRFYLWYHTPRKSGLRIQKSLCPPCARKDIDAAENLMTEKWNEMHPQQWREWMEKVKKDRAIEGGFWEQAQERRVKGRVLGANATREERRPLVEIEAVKETTEKGIAKEAKVVKEEKKSDGLKELCVVM